MLPSHKSLALVKEEDAPLTPLEAFFLYGGEQKACIKMIAEPE
jgi:hypothetical protein